MTLATKPKQLIAYHGDKAIRKKYLDRVKAHYKADEIIHGTYWQDGKGCAVGCTVHSNSHEAYETELGIPRLLARLEDGIFESLQNGRAKEWPVQFLSAIKVGADLSDIWPQFAVWLLIDGTWGVLQFAKTDKQRESINAVAKFYMEGKYAKPGHYDEIKKIRAYAAAASAAADAAAAYAAYAYRAYAAYAYAADANAAAAAAADAYGAAYAAAAYAYGDGSKWREAQADKLLELLKGAPLAVLYPVT